MLHCKATERKPRWLFLCLAAHHSAETFADIVADVRRTFEVRMNPEDFDGLPLPFSLTSYAGAPQQHTTKTGIAFALCAPIAMA